MTEAALLQALRDAHVATPEEGEGATMAELAKSTGLNDKRLRTLLRSLIDGGRARPARRLVRNIAGVSQPTPSYVFVAPKRGKK